MHQNHAAQSIDRIEQPEQIRVMMIDIHSMDAA
jgi:hypothetical protein